MTNAQWLQEVYDALIVHCDSWAILALDAVEAAMRSPADAALFHEARDIVELAVCNGPPYGNDLLNLL